MNIKQKLDKLNKLNNYGLSITYFDIGGWTINSYEDNTPLNMRNHYPYIHNKDINKALDEALKISLNEDN